MEKTGDQGCKGLVPETKDKDCGLREHMSPQSWVLLGANMEDLGVGRLLLGLTQAQYLRLLPES